MENESSEQRAKRLHSESSMRWQKANPDKVKEYQKTTRNNNRAKYNAYMREFRRRKAEEKRAEMERQNK
jgi:hypothetical protein